jgi:cell division septation protein DedD
MLFIALGLLFCLSLPRAALASCTSPPTPASAVFTAAQILAILDAHNDARRTVSPAAAVMPMLSWDANLAAWEQTIANTCPGLVHSTNGNRTNLAGYAYVGENLVAGSALSAANAASAIGYLVAERDFWTYAPCCGGCQAGEVCGHYTQIVWAATTKVGCGLTFCPGSAYGYYWRCAYGPGGNYLDENVYVEASTSPVAACQITSSPTTPRPSTSSPTTLSPTSFSPVTEMPSAQPSVHLAAAPVAAPTAVPTMVAVPSAQPSALPTSSSPVTTGKPSTSKPTTSTPTTSTPTTSKPTTAKPTTSAPTTAKPSTAKPTSKSPTLKPTTKAPTKRPTLPTKAPTKRHVGI